MMNVQALNQPLSEAKASVIEFCHDINNIRYIVILTYQLMLFHLQIIKRHGMVLRACTYVYVCTPMTTRSTTNP